MGFDPAELHLDFRVQFIDPLADQFGLSASQGAAACGDYYGFLASSQVQVLPPGVTITLFGGVVWGDVVKITAIKYGLCRHGTVEAGEGLKSIVRDFASRGRCCGNSILS